MKRQNLFLNRTNFIHVTRYMFLDEKIERLKKIFSPADFKVPFNDASNILRSIEAEFIFIKDLASNLNNLRNHFNNWPQNIKNKIEVKSVKLSDQNSWIDSLDSNANYWTVITFGNSPSNKYFVYDCKPKAVAALISLTQYDFFIIEKKYTWFSYFQVDRQKMMATIFKSGETNTPFEI